MTGGRECYVEGCKRLALWIDHDEDYGDQDSCAKHAGYTHWEEMQTEAEGEVAAFVARRDGTTDRMCDARVGAEWACARPEGHTGEHDAVFRIEEWPESGEHQ